MASFVVVGAGLSGLVCAARLIRAGHEALVLEAQPAVGGRLRPIVTEHGPLEPAVGEIGEGDVNLRALVAALGLEPKESPLVERSHALVLGGKLHRPPPLRPWEVLVPRLSPRIDRPIDAVFWRRPRWRLRRGVVRGLWDASRKRGVEVPDSVRALDDQTWSRASIRAFGTRWCATRLAPALLARTGLDLSAESAAIVVMMLVRLWSGGGRTLPLAGGLASLVERLAAALPVRLGARVEALESTAEGVRVRYRTGGREESVFADAAVVALPPSEILRVCPKLTPAERGHLESFQPRRAIVVHRFVSDPAWLLRGLAGVTFVPGEIPDMRDLRILGRPSPSSSSSPSSSLSPDPFWIRISFERESVDEHWGLSDQVLIAKVDAAFRGSPIGDLPAGPSRVERIPELMSVQGRGALERRALFECRSERSPRLAFATEAFTTPDLEGRVTAGMRGAAAAIDSLGDVPVRAEGGGANADPPGERP